MSSTLVVTTRRIERREHGYELRVANLCRQLGAEQHLLVVPIERDAAPAEPTIEMTEVFESVTEVSDADFRDAALLRHFRLSEEHFLKRAYPRFHARAVRALRETMVRTSADRLIVFGSGLAGIAAAAGTSRVLFDVCDSITLALRRQLDFDARTNGRGARWPASGRLALHRWRTCEGRLPRSFAQVTTINDADSDEIRSAAGLPEPANVHTVPNGVTEGLLDAHRKPQAVSVNGVAFWGNLAFAPNREALRHFLRDIYLPYLEGSGIEVCIVGRGAEPWLVELASQHPNIKLLGFVEDLAGVIRRYPVMVNPMVIGSGMKNKVLEAFAAKLAVVSTPLGMESIAGAIAGRHHVAADRPSDFAQAVLRLCAAPHERRRLVEEAARLVEQRYTWSAIGASWRALHDGLREAPRGVARPAEEASIA